MFMYEFAKLQLKAIHGFKKTMNTVCLPGYALLFNVRAKILEHLV
jgi:hypothetical protein